jgi:predicted small metal-binding protein
MPTFVCRDIGMDCDFKASASTEAELLGKIAEHAKSAHNIDKISPELMDKVKKAVKM